MTDVMTSEWSNVTTSSGVEETTAETATGRGQVGRVLVIVRVTILLILTVFNLCGNGFTLVTIRLTPRLWTKTNFILASMLAADVMTAVFMFFYIPFILIVFVFNNPCHYSAVTTAVTVLMQVPGLVSIYHLILISIERYIAIVYPLHYEIKCTNQTLKWAIVVVWATGIFVKMTHVLWVINADVSKCDLIPPQYHLVDVCLVYIPVCISLFTSYGKILTISWRQRRLIYPEPVHGNLASEAPVQTTPISTVPSTQNSNAGSSTENTLGPKHEPLADTGPSTQPAVTSHATSADLAQQQQHQERQQRQKMKSRRREFKAVYLTGAIVGVFVILWFPPVLGRLLTAVGYKTVVVNYLHLAGGAIGAANFAFSWAIYAAVSKSYRRAYRQMLIRIGCCCCKNVTLQADNSLVV